MLRSLSILLALSVFTCSYGTLLAQVDSVKYVPDRPDSILKVMEEIRDSVEAIEDSITSEILDSLSDIEDIEEEDRKRLRFDFSKIAKPESPDVFSSNFHFTPVAQFNTGTCWAFAGTSMIESEVARLTGRQIKLSEMFGVYHEYIEKARNFVRLRGDFYPGQGSQANAIIRMVKLYGAVPSDVYTGRLPGQDRHDHEWMSDEYREYLNFVESNDIWNEQYVLDHVRLILNKHMGEPPSTFEYEGRTLTPIEFAQTVLEFKPDDYANMMSTLKEPFYTQAEYDVHDNWWHDSSYYNVPINEYYDLFKSAVTGGYAVAVSVDVSEPGWNGFEDACVIPDFDIPQDYINQHSREFRINNQTTTDDHGVHIVGYTQIDGRDWYLIKDSSRSGRQGKYEGYFFWRDDYVKLKVSAFSVHKDALPDGIVKPH